MGHPSQSGVFLLSHDLDTFVGRALLACLTIKDIRVVQTIKEGVTVYLAKA